MGKWVAGWEGVQKQINILEIYYMNALPELWSQVIMMTKSKMYAFNYTPSNRFKIILILAVEND